MANAGQKPAILLKPFPASGPTGSNSTGGTSYAVFPVFPACGLKTVGKAGSGGSAGPKVPPFPCVPGNSESTDKLPVKATTEVGPRHFRGFLRLPPREHRITEVLRLYDAG
jgi:hypothetical protein